MRDGKLRWRGRSYWVFDSRVMSAPASRNVTNTLSLSVRIGSGNENTRRPSTSDQPQSKLPLTASVANDEVLDPRCQVFISKVGAATDFARDVVVADPASLAQTSAILLPSVLAWNTGDPKASSRQQQLAEEMGMEGQLSHIIGDYIAALGQPRRLSAAGVRQDQFAKIARNSMIMLEHPSVSGNLRRVENERDILEILDHAW
ncbi:hypothetical protein V1281_006277 [Nitrobacteraceae bacterium AZCC 2161]